MKALYVSIICIVSFLVGCYRPSKETIASFNDKTIMNEDYSFYLDNYRNLQSDLDDFDLKKSVVESLAYRTVVENEFDKMNLSVDEAKLSDFESQIVEEMGGDRELDEYLESKNISKDFFNDYLKFLYKKNMVKSEFKKTLNITQQTIEREYTNKPGKYDTYKVQFIFMKDLDSMREKVLLSSAGMDVLAILYSEDPVSASNGGIVENYKLGTKEPKFDLALQALNIAETSGVVETKNGYYIIKLIDRTLGASNHKEEIVNDLVDRSFNHYLKNLRNDLKVKIYRDLSK